MLKIDFDRFKISALGQIYLQNYSQEKNKG